MAAFLLHRFISPLTVLLLVASSISAQQRIMLIDDLPDKDRKIYLEAKKQSKKGQTEKALKAIKKVVNKYPDLLEGLLSLGGLYYRQKNYESSANYFQKALTLDSLNAEVHYALGTVYEDQKNYQQSASYFDSYIGLVDSTAAKYTRAKLKSADMHFAAHATANPVQYNPIPLSNINTVYSEYLPVLSGDQQEIIFIRRYRNQEDLYSAIRTSDTSFAEAVPLVDLNTNGNEGTHTLSADGNLLVFTACDRLDGYGLCDLYYSRRTDSGWSRAINMGKRVNSASSDSSPSLTADGRGLYFVSDRIGSLGGRDIWYTQLRADGLWHRPVNLGDVINTRGNEESPFIHQDGVTLYYRSNGLPGMGDYDIYYSRWDDGWPSPTNIGYPINTEGSEGSLHVSLDGTTGYYSSDKDHLGNRRKDLDLFQFEIHEAARPLPVTFVSGRISDATSGSGLPAKLSLIVLDSKRVSYTVTADKNGEYFLALPALQRYALTVKHPGYIYYSAHYDLSDISVKEEPYQLDIELDTIPRPSQADTTYRPSTRPVVLNNVFFDSGSTALLPESDSEIAELAALLREQSQAIMTITGHTDNVGSPQANLQLSISRAESVKNAIVALGISEDRIIAKGVGEVAPVASNDSEEGRKANRRVEFVLSLVK